MFLLDWAEPGKYTCTTCQKICKIKGGLTRYINEKDSPFATQKQDQSLKLECIFNLLKEGNLKAEETYATTRSCALN